MFIQQGKPGLLAVYVGPVRVFLMIPIKPQVRERTNHFNFARRAFAHVSQVGAAFAGKPLSKLRKLDSGDFREVRLRVCETLSYEAP